MSVKGENNGVNTALYRKYRPHSLDEIVSQNHATDILRRSLKQGKISHAYLLTGPKGVGKTSIARILAHQINQIPYDDDEPHLDIVEIDAASNNGIEDIRDLRDRANIAPIASSHKIYIIDEVHMLSKQAFNALLKTLEEPPAHVIFILATTDLHKVPATIISRTQHFAFHSISRIDLATQLKKIAKSEKIKISDSALDVIASLGDGSFRNAISILDQMSGYADKDSGITNELVESTIGLASTDSVQTLMNAVADGDVTKVINTLDKLENDGIQPGTLTDQLIETSRNRLIKQPQMVELLDSLLDVSRSSQPRIKLLVALVSATKPKATITKATVATKPQPTVIEAPVIVIDKKDFNHEAVQMPKASTNKINTTDQPLDWSAFLDYIKTNQVPLYSVLVKCGHEFIGNTLTIYAGRKFNKTKLDEPRYRSVISDALSSQDQSDVQIVVYSTTKPPADKNLARVAEIMGGGTEVTLDEEEATK